MRAPINCDVHGQQRRAFVCAHIIETFKDKAPRGFVWQRDAEGEYEALCTAYCELPPEQWAKCASELARPICLECFAEAGRWNGVDWGAGT